MRFQHARVFVGVLLALSMVLPGPASWQGAAAQVATPVADLTRRCQRSQAAILPGNPKSS